MNREEIAKKLLEIRLGEKPTKSVLDIICDSENLLEQSDYIEKEIEKAKAEARVEVAMEIFKNLNKAVDRAITNAKNGHFKNEVNSAYFALDWVSHELFAQEQNILYDLEQTKRGAE